MKSFIFLVMVAGTVSACAVKQNPAHTTIYTPAGAVDYHCPPGHAKKGQC